MYGVHDYSETPGSCMYVADEGKFEVIQSGRVVDSIGPGEVFGELAILYNCPRTASVKGLSEPKIYFYTLFI